MKKFLMLCLCACAVCGLSAAPKIVNFNKLPDNSQEFIRKHFPNEKVKSVEMDREASWDKYTVLLENGTQVMFSGGSGDCSEIVAKKGAVPTSALPARLRTYTSTQYPHLRIVSYKTTADGYRLQLSDQSYVDFDSNGNYVKASK